MTAVAVSELLGISQSAVTRAAYRGESIVAANNLKLILELTHKDRPVPCLYSRHGTRAP
jgi:hypothetical protein